MIKKAMGSFCFLLGMSFGGLMYAYSFAFDPYIGVGTSFLHVKGAKQQHIAGRRIEDLSKYQKKNLNTLDGFVGLKITDYFGIELGYQHSGKNKKLTKGNFLNDPALNSPEVKTQFAFRNLYLDFNGFLPLTDCWILNASVGISHLEPVLSYRIHDDHVVNATINNFSALDSVSSKNVLKAGLGVIYQFTERMSFRVKGEYLNTSRLRGNFNDAAQAPTDLTFPNAKLFKDSYLVSLSIITKLF